MIIKQPLTLSMITISSRSSIEVRWEEEKLDTYKHHLVQRAIDQKSLVINFTVNRAISFCSW
ncbi:MAG: hypothetical protein AB8B34_09025 [Prochlorococcus sp.]